MPTFVGRKNELNDLENAYKLNTFQFAVVYGRRRVGKTSLLQAFAGDKTNVCFFTARETTIGENVRLLYRSLATLDSAFGLVSPAPTAESIQKALDEVFQLAQKKRVLLIIDEYPYLAACYPGISSYLQVLIDEQHDVSKLFLILCGSSMSFMEHQVMGYKSPLYGRRTMQVRLKPFSVFDAQRMLPKASLAELVELYSIVGGIPMYLSQLDDAQTTKSNLASHILRQGAYLYIEPENYLLQEVRNPAIYNAVVSAIASGHVRPKEIADVTGINASQVSQLLDALVELQIVVRVTPQVHAKKRQVVYRVCDNLFRFWYRFVPSYENVIEAGGEERVAKHIVEHDLSTFVGPVFEEVCRQWLLHQMVIGKLDVFIKAIGTWWGTNPQTKQQEEIDIVLEESDGGLMIGECKWRNEPTDVDVLDTLMRRGALLGERIDRYYVFSKSGFTDACRNRAASMPNAELVSLEDIF